MSEVENEAPVVVPVETPAVEAPPVEATPAEETPAPVVTPVVAQAPSSSVVHYVVSEVESKVVSLEDAVRNLVALVKDHRRAGDADVEAAMKDVDAAIAAKQ